MTARSLPLRLDDRSLILAQKDVLYVFNRRGAFDLRGKDIETLHARLAPHLQGTHGEEALLAAVPSASAGPLLSYFDKLRQVGALRTDTEPAGEAARPLDELGPDCRRGRFAWRGHCVEISLEGPWPAPQTAGVARLEFPAPRGGWPLALATPGAGPWTGESGLRRRDARGGDPLCGDPAAPRLLRSLAVGKRSRRRTPGTGTPLRARGAIRGASPPGRAGR